MFSFGDLFLDKTGRVVRRENLGNREDVDVTILVAKESMGKSIIAHFVPQKGVDMEHCAVDLLLKDLKWIGYQKVGLKSDNERAILRLLEHAVTEARLEITNLEQPIEEHPNTYDSSSNGEVEVAVKSRAAPHEQARRGEEAEQDDPAGAPAVLVVGGVLLVDAERAEQGLRRHHGVPESPRT